MITQCWGPDNELEKAAELLSNDLIDTACNREVEPSSDVKIYKGLETAKRSTKFAYKANFYDAHEEMFWLSTALLHVQGLWEVNLMKARDWVKYARLAGV